MAAPNARLSKDLNRARFGRQVAGLVALDRCGGYADLLAQFFLNRRRSLAVAGRDAADAGFEQTAEGLVAHSKLLTAYKLITDEHSLSSLRRKQHITLKLHSPATLNLPR